MNFCKIMPSPNSSVGRVSGCGAKGLGFKSCVLVYVFTNDFIIFDFSLLKHKFQEIEMNLCLAPIA